MIIDVRGHLSAPNELYAWKALVASYFLEVDVLLVPMF